MKRLLTLTLLLILSTRAGAALQIMVNGQPASADIYLHPGDLLNLGILTDSMYPPSPCVLTVQGPGEVEAYGCPCEWPEFCVGEDWCYWDLCEWPMGMGYCDELGIDDGLYIEFLAFPPIPAGIVVEGILYHAEAPGDVTLSLYIGDWDLYLIDSVTIHQVVDPPPLEILDPNGGEYHRGGTWQEIRFADYRTPGDHAPNYQLQLSVDNGQTWMFWIGGPEPNCEEDLCSWQWHTPEIDGDQYLIQVFDANDPMAADTSDAPFVIYTGRLFVSAVDGNDTNNGITPETPFATIQKAIDLANDGDIITVAQSTYAENINLLGKNITLTSTGPTNSAIVKNTTIDGTVTFRGTEDPNCTLTGFNINGPIAGYDWEIDPAGENHTHATISHCILDDIVTGCGQLIQACDGTISHCVIAKINYMCGRPGPVPQIVGCHGLIENCTMADMQDGIEILPGGTCTLRNCIFHRSYGTIVAAEATLNISYCRIERDAYGVIGEGAVNWGPGNIEADPCFADVGTWGDDGDYHLKSQAGRWDPSENSKSEIRNPKLGEGAWIYDEVMSLCIDAGDPMTPINFEPFPNGGIVNMGAFGGSPEASKSYFGKPPCETIVAGDVNGDCIIDFKDAAIIFFHWLEDASP